jgi:hypothetical protein
MKNYIKKMNKQQLDLTFLLECWSSTTAEQQVGAAPVEAAGRSSADRSSASGSNADRSSTDQSSAGRTSRSEQRRSAVDGNATDPGMGERTGVEGRRPGERTARKGGGRRREGKAAASRRRLTLTLAGKGEHRGTGEEK